MISIAYTRSLELSNNLKLLEKLRKDLHTAPISREAFYESRWRAIIQRIEFFLKQEGSIVSTEEIAKILHSDTSRSEKADKIRRYKKALDYIYSDWYVTDENISPHTIATLDAFLTVNSKNALSKRTPAQSLYDIKQLISYVQSGDEHPVIQAGIACVEIIHKGIVPVNSFSLATLITYAFLYKYGWDFRELLVLEKAWEETRIDYLYTLESTKETNNATAWLDYFVQTLISQIQHILNSLHVHTNRLDSKMSGIQLTNRLQEILALLDNPQSHITNKKVQETFKVSQVTASRDLSKLTQMGLLFSHGSGRSTYYTRL